MNNQGPEAAERFVLGQMEGAELDDYLARLLHDRDLQREVEAARIRLHELRTTIHPTAPPPALRWRWVLLVILLLLAGRGLYKWVRPDPTLTPQHNTAVPDTLPTPTGSSVDRIRPNPELENQLGGGLYTGEGLEGFRWTQPPETRPVFFRRNTLIPVTFTGVAVVPADVLPQLQWRLFTNDPADYAAGRTRHRATPEQVALGGDNYRLSGAADLALAPGLYYFVITDLETAEVYFVGKFLVEE